MLNRIENAKPTYPANDFEKKYLVAQYRVNTLCDYRDFKKAENIQRSLSEGTYKVKLPNISADRN